jgi:hypothetical protein
MADISVLSRLINGLQRNVDLSSNSLVVGSLKVGSVTPTELTKAILDRLVALQNGSDVDATYHTHDGRYFTESELGAASGTTGSDLVGDDDSYTNFTPTAATVKGALEGIDSALGAVTSDTKDVKVSANDTTPGYLEDKIVSANSMLTITTLNDGGNEDLQLTVVNSAIDHGALAGLADDDHTQYHNDARGDARYYQKTEFVTTATAGAPVKLDGAGKIAVAQLPSAIMTYEGVWNASTNSPTLADGIGDAGMVYRVGTAGTQDLGSGNITFDVGDYIIYNGTVWEKSDTTDAVASVNGQTGVVVLDTDDIAEGANLYFTDERAQDAIGTILVDSATVDFTYNDGTPSITASVKNNSIDENMLTASVAGDGLAGGNGTALSVNVDNSTIEINTDTLRIKDAGVTAAKLATGVADQSTITGGAGSALAVQHAPRGLRPVVAGESMAANTSFLVRWAVNGETAGRVYKADKDASTSDKFYAWGIALKTSAVSAGDSVNVTFEGTHTLGSSDTNFNATDIGKAVYLTAAGAFSVTAPTTVNEAVWRVGVVQDVDKIWVGDKQLNGIN